ncbi:unnamed protein product [Acanthoscelides obtectus]|uniref:Uncharacterized protein n=1 Tax=Acanthoscelides obtectus TaxID=200917 RepID=A0A9P0KSF7_ACAOB|nr:unnamed protein product [Acanthoscelides obtectus]CAK1635913.1 hypothetical protein AOBTE_LOCUS9620 [Acanthoscelides obtectus]
MLVTYDDPRPTNNDLKRTSADDAEVMVKCWTFSAASNRSSASVTSTSTRQSSDCTIRSPSRSSSPSVSSSPRDSTSGTRLIASTPRRSPRTSSTPSAGYIRRSRYPRTSRSLTPRCTCPGILG